MKHGRENRGRAMNDLPIPRFQIGQTVFSPGTRFTDERHDCPDCLGERRWKATTPAGDELELQCLRCQGQGVLKRPNFIPATRKLTIGSVRIDTHVNPGWGQTNVQYMCDETGIGSGTVYNEDRLFESEDLADAESGRMAEKQTVEHEARAEKDTGIQRAYAHKFFDLRTEEERQAKRKAENERDDILQEIVDALVCSHDAASLRSAIDAVLKAHGWEE